MSWRLTQRTGADPYADWLRAIGSSPAADGWCPRVIYTPWGLLGDALKRNAQATIKALEALFSGASSYRVNLHDLEHWAQSDYRKDETHFGQGHNELIIFEKAGNPCFDLPELLEHALAAPFAGVVSTSDAGAAVSVGVPACVRGNLTHSFAVGAGVVSKQVIPAAIAASGDRDTPLVITAIIDHAIPFAHNRFRQSQTQSRIDGIWLQGTPWAQSRVGPAIGRALSGADIAGLLRQIGSTFRDETALYSSVRSGQTVGQRQSGDAPLQQSYSHGGMMLDLAAGREASDPHGPRHRILAVQLPAQIVAQTNGFLHELFVKSAVNWIWFMARALYADHPHEVILNYSFGDFCGRRDGQGMLDADFQLRLDRAELAAITVSAGNGFQSDCHAEISAADIVQGQELTLCLQPDDKTPTFVQFWLDGDYDTLPFDLEITPPKTSGIASIVTALEDDVELVDQRTGAAVARVYYQHDTPVYALPTGAVAAPRTRVTLAFCPTAAQGTQAMAAAGRWTISFRARAHCDLPADEKIMLWVERGDSLPGFLPKGRQARLDHPAHVRIAASGRWNTDLDPAGTPIKRRGTLSANANAADVLSAGAARRGDAGRFAVYSAAGTGRAPSGPTVAVEVERSDSRRSVLGAGTLSGAARLGNGTSSASAAMSRHLADAMLSGAVPVGSPEIVQRLKAHLIAQARPTTNPARSGAGVLPASAARRA